MLKGRNRGLWICIFVVILLFALEINKGIFYYANAFGTAIRANLYDAKSFITQKVSTHFNQTAQLESLRQIAQEKEQNDILIANLNDIIAKMQTLLNLNKKLESRLAKTHLVEAYAYTNMGKYSQVWLKSDTFTPSDENRVFGLLKDGHTAGIALVRDGKLLGILNGDSKASYGVYIGEGKSVGILKSDIDNAVVVEYINAWNVIKEGDEITTNGLDGIFFAGISVGRVKAVRQEYGYIVADVELYNQNSDIGYFWLVDVAR